MNTWTAWGFRRTGPVTAAALALTLIACVEDERSSPDADDSRGAEDSSLAADASPEPAPGTTSHDDPQPEQTTRSSSPRGPRGSVREPITVSFAGDIHFEGELRTLLDDPENALDPVAADLSDADLTVVNLESAVGSGGTPEPKRYTFQAPPAALEALSAAGVDVVTMANNHAMDFGPDGFADTLAAAEQARDAQPPLSVVGIGADTDDAFTPAVRDVGGVRVAVLGASTPDDPTADPTEHWAATEDDPGIAVALDHEPLVEAVDAARADADVVIVYMHWGIQGERCPSESQQDLARALADAGADIVVGSHAHRLQGAGMLDDTYVSYGLGNFAWYTQNSRAASTTGVLTVEVDGGQVSAESWAPARIGPDGLPEFVTGDEAEDMADDVAQLRECTDLEPLGPS
ncbi:CapA family protein [Actinobacteria bacterium YIM 96077]|uniref:CapA family protein n=1 Tax=Phytoactinopolyspora halophila TaxID=1981511 RepID=A0A329QZL3_9ACTN|nr:CapA family protein [Phytoactinopolyspora halophila]AYY11726.1 CapA family protein [Actinobacteria bacterium YIM 96077]RAW17840.1 CapA family protein [Phytoactinopolyspora halophila]